MFEAGTLLYFSPFIFKNGAQPKNKYFLILGSDGDNLLLASLPTSKDHIPNGIEVKHGACELPELGVSAFVLLANEVVTENGFAFEKNTFMYGEQVDTFPFTVFQQQISLGQTQVKVVGAIKGDLFDEIKRFIQGSSRVKKKHKTLVSP